MLGVYRPSPRESRLGPHYSSYPVVGFEIKHTLTIAFCADAGLGNGGTRPGSGLGWGGGGGGGARELGLYWSSPATPVLGPPKANPRGSALQ